jgi:dipeptidyl aminopeptidase/acylaminoacyl peptidase
MRFMSVMLTLLLANGCSTAAKKSESSGYQGHGVESVNAETLKQFAPPPLSSEFTSRIQSMLDVRAPGLGRVTPDGKRLFFNWGVTGISQIWRVDGPKNFPLQMTGGEDRTSLSTMTPDGKFVIISRDRKGEENPGLYLQSVDGGALIEVQHKKSVQTHAQWVTHDSKYLFYSANDVRPDSYTIYRYDINNRKAEKIFDEPGIWGISDASADGSKLLLEKATGSLRGEIYEYEMASKKLTPLIGQGETEDYSAQYGAGQGELLVRTNKFGDFYRLYSWKGGKFTAITPETKTEVDSAIVDVPKKRIYLSINEGGFTRLTVLDAKTFKPVSLPKFPKADHIYIGSITRDGRFVTIGVETARAPRSSYVLDWETGRLTEWVLPSSPEINTANFSEPKLEYYTARDGTKIPMFVRRPAKCPCPVVVHFHGGPEGQSTPGFSTFAQIFIDNGYIYVEPNVRGSTGYGKTWLHSDNGAKRLNVITDIEDAALFIKKNWAVNGQAPQVGVMGYSYGGYSTLIAMTMFGGTYDAGVALVGMSNLYTFMQNTAPYRRILRKNEYGDPETEKDLLLKLSAVSYLDRIRDPLMIVQGAGDPRVPAGEAVQMYEAMKKKGISSELIIFADEGHGSAKRDNRVLEIGHMIKFFNAHLKTGAPQTAKP